MHDNITHTNPTQLYLLFDWQQPVIVFSPPCVLPSSFSGSVISWCSPLPAVGCVPSVLSAEALGDVKPSSWEGFGSMPDPVGGSKSSGVKVILLVAFINSSNRLRLTVEASGCTVPSPPGVILMTTVEASSSSCVSSCAPGAGTEVGSEGSSDGRGIIEELNQRLTSAHVCCVKSHSGL